MPAFNFQSRFADMVKNGNKLQTIRNFRKDKRMPCKVGDKLSLYTGQRTAYCSLLRTAICTHISEIEIHVGHMFIAGVSFDQMNEIARLDGFKDWHDMRLWFLKTHGSLPFHGWLIKWERKRTSTAINPDDLTNEEIEAQCQLYKKYAENPIRRYGLSLTKAEVEKRLAYFVRIKMQRELNFHHVYNKVTCC